MKLTVFTFILVFDNNGLLVETLTLIYSKLYKLLNAEKIRNSCTRCYNSRGRYYSTKKYLNMYDIFTELWRL